MSKYITICLTALLFTALAGSDRVNFSNIHSKRSPWKSFGKIPFIPKVKFYTVAGDKYPDDCRIVIESNKASGLLICYPDVDVKKTPIMRWRWRLRQALDVDNKEEQDEQAVVLYVGDGNSFRQRTVAYRWEGCPEIGSRSDKIYSAGAVKMGAICMRNKHTPVDKWVTEERNVRQDFKSFFGDEMEKCGIAIGANSQYSKQLSVAEIDYIEFLTEEEAAAHPVPVSEK